MGFIMVMLQKKPKWKPVSFQACRTYGGCHFIHETQRSKYCFLLLSATEKHITARKDLHHM